MLEWVAAAMAVAAGLAERTAAPCPVGSVEDRAVAEMVAKAGVGEAG